jgi:hypothetical protein
MPLGSLPLQQLSKFDQCRRCTHRHVHPAQNLMAATHSAVEMVAVRKEAAISQVNGNGRRQTVEKTFSFRAPARQPNDDSALRGVPMRYL